MRIREAKILLDAGEFDGAYYLAGYAVECALKACILKRLSDYWPDESDRKMLEKCYTHDLEHLLKAADLVP
jgi:HEPN domain-containing protein